MRVAEPQPKVPLLVQISFLIQSKISERKKKKHLKGTKGKSGVFLFPCLGQTFAIKVLVVAGLASPHRMENNAAHSSCYR